MQLPQLLCGPAVTDGFFRVTFRMTIDVPVLHTCSGFKHENRFSLKVAPFSTVHRFTLSMLTGVGTPIESSPEFSMCEFCSVKPGPFATFDRQQARQKASSEKWTIRSRRVVPCVSPWTFRPSALPVKVCVSPLFNSLCIVLYSTMLVHLQ